MLFSKKIVHQTLACSTVLFNQFLIGIVYGWVPITLKKLRDYEDPALRISNEGAAWMVSIHEMGKISGPIFTPFIIDTLGRRASMMGITYFLFLMWPALFFINNVHLICTTRFLFGCVHGIFDVLSSIYITENCSPSMRVVMGSLVSIVFTAGISLETALATYLSYQNTTLVNATIAACSFSTFLWCIETPYFLTMKLNISEAKKNLMWLQGINDLTDGSKQIEIIQKDVFREKMKTKSFKTLFSSTANLKSICIVLSIHMISMMTGSSCIAPYSSMIFPASEKVSSNEFVIMYGTSIFAASCLSPFIVAVSNRRTLLIVCFSVIGVSHFCTSFFFYLHNRGYEMAYYPWLIFGSIEVYGVVRITFGPALYIIRAELLPLSVRAIGGAMAVMASAITGFFMAITFLPLVSHFGMETCFLVYGITSVLMSIIICYYLPETRGKSLDEIQKQITSDDLEKKGQEIELESSEIQASKQMHILFR